MVVQTSWKMTSKWEALQAKSGYDQKGNWNWISSFWPLGVEVCLYRQSIYSHYLRLSKETLWQCIWVLLKFGKFFKHFKMFITVPSYAKWRLYRMVSLMPHRYVWLAKQIISIKCQCWTENNRWKLHKSPLNCFTASVEALKTCSFPCDWFWLSKVNFAMNANCQWKDSVSRMHAPVFAWLLSSSIRVNIGIEATKLIYEENHHIKVNDCQVMDGIPKIMMQCAKLSSEANNKFNYLSFKIVWV